MSDEMIMIRIKEGKLEEMSLLFDRYHLKLYNFFFRLTYNMDVSQDLTQNLFYRMIKYRGSYREEYSVKSWIFQIARNLHADYCRDEKKSSDLIIAEENFQKDVPEEANNFSEDDYRRLELAMSALPENQREILVLSRFQGLKYEEISEIMNQSVPAIKVTVHRAIKQLRGIFFKQYDHEV